MKTIKGIDVSKWQGTIDWAKVKASGIDFAILRCSFGRASSQKDAMFETNYKNAKAAGMPVGAYHYSYATTVEQAKAEAQLCLNTIKGKTFEYPIYFDIEDPSQSSLSKSTISAIIKAFCKTVEEAGYYVGIYANLSWLNTKIDDECKKRYDVWLAQWSGEPTYTGSFGMWQNSSKGTVPGISGNVDTDVSYKDYPSIIKKNGLNGFTKTAAKPATTPAAKPATTPATTPAAKPVVKVYKKGDAVKLTKAPLFISATASKATTTKTGTYYIYDGIKTNGRYRITNKSGNCGKKPIALYVTGWVKL